MSKTENNHIFHIETILSHMKLEKEILNIADKEDILDMAERILPLCINYVYNLSNRLQ